jgi:polar amino acid transport system substrate-binding protein
MMRFGGIVLAAGLPLFALSGCETMTQADPHVAMIAPGGKLRVGLYTGAPTSIVIDATTGDRKGVAFDVGAEIARRLGVTYEPVIFPRNADILPALKDGKLDLVFTNASPAREKDIAFAPPALFIEQGYLVPKGSPIASLEQVDRAGVRVGVSQGSTSQTVLARELKNAQVVPAANSQEAIAMLASGGLSAFATNKSILYQMAADLPGSTVLPGRLGLERLSFGIAKERADALRLLVKVVDGVTRDGTVARAAEHAGLRGVVAADSK